MSKMTTVMVVAAVVVFLMLLGPFVLMIGADLFGLSWSFAQAFGAVTMAGVLGSAWNGVSHHRG